MFKGFCTKIQKWKKYKFKTKEGIKEIGSSILYIILSKNNDFKVNNENVEIVHSVSELKKYIECDEECFVIGGTMIYNLLMPFVEKMYITQINQEFEGDAIFPDINKEEWKEIEREKGIQNEKNPLDYEYITYEKIKK